MNIRSARTGYMLEQWETTLSPVQLCEECVEGYIEFAWYPENQREINQR